jgi:hypothetical protein
LVIGAANGRPSADRGNDVFLSHANTVEHVFATVILGAA